MIAAAGFLLGLAGPFLGCAIGWTAGRGSLREPGFFRAWLLAASAWAVLALLPGWLDFSAGDALSAAVALVLWRWSRRKRGRAPRSYGAKSLALVGRLTRSMPRWSPRLQPQGAGA